MGLSLDVYKRQGGTTASADPNFDESICGEAVASFSSEEILSSLQANAAQGITWIRGMNGPTFQWDKLHISAVYTEVEKAIAQANALNREQYQNFEIVDEALASVVYLSLIHISAIKAKRLEYSCKSRFYACNLLFLCYNK